MLERRLANLQEQLERLYQQYDLETRFEEKMRLEPIIEDKEKTIEQVKAQIEQAAKPKLSCSDAPQVFISYGRDDGRGQRLAEQIEQRLLEAGLRVFRDVHGLQAGDVWFSKLEKGLLDSSAMVLVVSEKARNSQWVFNEYDMAREHDIKVIPVLAEDVRKPLWLRHLQVLDFQIHQDWSALLQACPMTSTSSIIIPQSLKPTWASAVGEDQYGQFADLVYKGVTQRFRLIKAGTFMMGSPKGEEGHREDEALHEVTLTQNFWLADTACTQELWQVVMGNNPARFKTDLQNPVEQVSWLDAQSFLANLNRSIPNLKAHLPTEAQWEYACRAGTITPFSFGENISPDLVNYNGKYPYANGEKGKYRGKTVPVKALPINQWGLYQMHGNVLEWCVDEWQNNLGAEVVIDPVNARFKSGVKPDKASIKTGNSTANTDTMLENTSVYDSTMLENAGDGDVYRLLRGGSWGINRCCSAIRYNYRAAGRDGNVGFRFALGHELQ